MQKPDKVDEWKQGRMRGFQGLAGEEHREIEKLKDRVVKGMTPGEASQADRAVEQLHAAIRAKFLRKCAEVEECETVKQVDQKAWSA